MYDDDLKEMEKILHAAKKAKIDFIIASDVSVLEYARKLNLKASISTQANISNIEAVRFFSKYADIIVLARELNLSQIKHITETIKNENIRGPGGDLVKIEIFIHGALCIAISGKCYMSLSQYNMSANRGGCLQACRRKYKVTEEETGKELFIDNKYIMSPKDLCTISVLDQITASGVDLLKIEGRARPPEYVKTVVKTYKDALDAINSNSYTKDKIDRWLNDLKNVFNRGFWHGGYYLGNDLDIWSKSYGSKALRKKTYVGKITNYYSKIKVAELQVEANELKINDEILIIGKTTGLIEDKITHLKSEEKKDIQIAEKKTTISFPLSQPVKKNDKLYILEQCR